MCESTLDPDTTNDELNEHLDLCLNGEAIGQSARGSPSPADDPPRKRPRVESRNKNKDRHKGSILHYFQQ